MRPSPKAAAIATLRIGAVSKATGLSPSTIRWYEKLGLILPQREASGYRTYAHSDVEWLLTLKAHFAASHSSPRCLADILAWLPMRELRSQLSQSQCTCRPEGGVCWLAGETTLQVRICRDCPAYANKDVALDLRRFFEARWKPSVITRRLKPS